MTPSVPPAELPKRYTLHDLEKATQAAFEAVRMSQTPHDSYRWARPMRELHKAALELSRVAAVESVNRDIRALKDRIVEAKASYAALESRLAELEGKASGSEVQ